MSVFGGDSWGREAQYRKRRVDDLVVESLSSSSSSASSAAPSYKKLPSGKYACLVCPHNPILDTPLMLSMHFKGSRHCVAESRLKAKELGIQDEINKRIALSECSAGTGASSTATKVNQRHISVRKPLIERTRKAASEILSISNTTPRHSEAKGNNDVMSSKDRSTDGPLDSDNRGSSLAIEATDNLVTQLQSDLRDRRERELKFTAAGWKRDGHGKWFKDENVEFDSDEDDPNVCLA